jgi:dTMP kinase
MMLFVLEGPDGCGKTTIINKLKELHNADNNVVFANDPGTTEIGNAVRSLVKNREARLDPITELYLFCAARHELVKHVILPSLREKKIVICDRFTPSTYVYQSLMGSDLRTLEIDEVIRLSMGDLYCDDICIIYLDISPEENVRRLHTRENKQLQFTLDAFARQPPQLDSFDAEDSADVCGRSAKISNCYKEIFPLLRSRGYTVQIIDANKDADIVCGVVDKVINKYAKGVSSQYTYRDRII